MRTAHIYTITTILEHIARARIFALDDLSRYAGGTRAAHTSDKKMAKNFYDFIREKQRLARGVFNALPAYSYGIFVCKIMGIQRVET